MTRAGLGICIVPALGFSEGGVGTSGLRLYTTGWSLGRIVALSPSQYQSVLPYGDMITALTQAGHSVALPWVDDAAPHRPRGGWLAPRGIALPYRSDQLPQVDGNDTVCKQGSPCVQNRRTHHGLEYPENLGSRLRHGNQHVRLGEEEVMHGPAAGLDSGAFLVLVLGAAAGGGVPQWNCSCPVCAAAWGDPAMHGGSVSLDVTGDGGAHWFLINASPICDSRSRNPKASPPIAAPCATARSPGSSPDQWRSGCRGRSAVDARGSGLWPLRATGACWTFWR